MTLIRAEDRHYKRLAILMTQLEILNAENYDEALMPDKAYFYETSAALSLVIESEELGYPLIYVDEQDQIRAFCLGYVKGTKGFIHAFWIDEELRGSPASRLCREMTDKMHEYFVEQKCTTSYCTVAEGNDAVAGMLIKVEYRPCSMNFAKELEE